MRFSVKANTVVIQERVRFTHDREGESNDRLTGDDVDNQIIRFFAQPALQKLKNGDYSDPDQDTVIDLVAIFSETSKAEWRHDVGVRYAPELPKDGRYHRNDRGCRMPVIDKDYI